MNKKATHFNEWQKCYLDEKFSIGQETGHKLDAPAVAQELRYPKDESGKVSGLYNFFSLLIVIFWWLGNSRGRRLFTKVLFKFHLLTFHTFNCPTIILHIFKA